MFDFRIITCLDGTEIIDRTKCTIYETLTPCEMVKYIETDIQLSIIDRMERKAREESERKRKISRNPLYKMACLCGLI